VRELVPGVDVDSAILLLALFAVYFGASAYFGETIGPRAPLSPSQSSKASAVVGAFLLLCFFFLWLVHRVEGWYEERKRLRELLKNAEEQPRRPRQDER
jgi:hypothetical protein